jgi:FkbM family methyltransferase
MIRRNFGPASTPEFRPLVPARACRYRAAVNDALEQAIYQRFLLAEGMVLEIAPGDGQWVAKLLQARPGLKASVLEVDPQFHQRLATDLADLIRDGRVALHPMPPDGLDAYAAEQRIRRLNCLKINGGTEWIGMRGAEKMLSRQAIDLVQFVYADAFRASGATLRQVLVFLAERSYTIFSLACGKMTHKQQVSAADEAELSAPYVAAAPRLLRTMANDKSILDISGLFGRHRIPARGVIHIGAHLGEELPLYRQMGFSRILLVEANPELAARIKSNTASDPAVIVANVAVSDADGSINLRVTSEDQSSSILPLKRHRNYYPAIHETRQVTVPSRKLPTLLNDLNLCADLFNYISLDIQGAELRALRGAGDLLRHIDIVETEVNYEELYEGCGLIEDLDDYLAGYGLERVDVACPFHPSWGDAAYVRRSGGTGV